MNVVSFFTGAGGLDLGFMQAGFDVKMCVEREAVFCETLRHNHPHIPVIHADIMELTVERIWEETKEREFDVFIGGSPCQSFSTMGKKQGFLDSRGLAMLKYASLIEAARPKMFVIENVLGFAQSVVAERPESDAPFVQDIEAEAFPMSAIDFLGRHVPQYHLRHEIVNSATFGVPQKRLRIILIGTRKDISEEGFVLPERQHAPEIPVGEILERLKDVPHDHVHYSPKTDRWMRMIPQGGGNWRDLPPEILPEAMGGAFLSGGGKTGFFRRIRFDRPAPTLLTSPVQKSTLLGHPFEHRPLSIQEYQAIQTFPDDYVVKGTIAQRYTQLGNAVPVRMARAIAGEMAAYLEKLQIEGKECRNT